MQRRHLELKQKELIRWCQYCWDPVCSRFPGAFPVPGIEHPGKSRRDSTDTLIFGVNDQFTINFFYFACLYDSLGRILWLLINLIRDSAILFLFWLYTYLYYFINQFICINCKWAELPFLFISVSLSHSVIRSQPSRSRYQEFSGWLLCTVIQIDNTALNRISNSHE